MNLNNNEQEIPEVQLEEYALKLDAKDFASRSKTKAKPKQKENLPALPQEQYLLGKEFGPMLNQGNIHSPDYGRQEHREDDGAIEFWRIIDNLQKHSRIVLVGLTTVGRKAWQEEEETRKYTSHSGRSLIDPTLQDSVVIPSNFFQYIYHVGCAINLHSIINSGLIPGGQSSSKRQTVFFLLVDPMDKSHKDPKVIDLSVPRHAQYLHNAWEETSEPSVLVDINLALKKG